MVESEICLRNKGSAMLVHPDYRGRVSEDWFQPAFWGEMARPVSSGGRGAAWFVEAGDRSLVLRKYRRGGMMAKLARQTYLFSRESEVRSFAEFRLLHRLEAMALPVPRPVAAWYRKQSPIQYQAAILIERLQGVVPLADQIAETPPEGWEKLGATIRRFHDAGVMHADLNCYNVLVRDDQYFLIDFDKSRLMGQGSPASWQQANLDRFARSLVKVAGEETRRRVWDSFMNGYNKGKAS